MVGSVMMGAAVSDFDDADQAGVVAEHGDRVLFHVHAVLPVGQHGTGDADLALGEGQEGVHGVRAEVAQRTPASDLWIQRPRHAVVDVPAGWSVDDPEPSHARRRQQPPGLHPREVVPERAVPVDERHRRELPLRLGGEYLWPQFGRARGDRFLHDERQPAFDEPRDDSRTVAMPRHGQHEIHVLVDQLVQSGCDPAAEPFTPGLRHVGLVVVHGHDGGAGRRERVDVAGRVPVADAGDAHPQRHDRHESLSSSMGRSLSWACVEPSS